MKKFFVIFLIFFCSFILHAQWEKLNWNLNTYIYTIFSSSNKIFLGTSIGIYSSDDNGDTWAKSDSGITYNYISDFSKSGNDIFAFSSNNVFKSTNNGTFWYNLTDTVSEMARQSFYPDNDIYYLGVVCEGLYMSMDKGMTWQRNKYMGGFLFTITGHKGNIYVGESTNGIFSTRDSGKTWNKVNLPEFVTYTMYTLTSSEDYLFSNQNGVLVPQGLTFYTSNGGSDWVKIDLKYVNCIRSWNDRFIAGTDSIGIVFSKNHGLSWEDIGQGLVPNTIINMEIFNDYIFISSSDKKIYRSKLSDLISSVEENEIYDALFLTPNPASDYITITLPSDAHTLKGVVEGVRLYDVFGRDVSDGLHLEGVDHLAPNVRIDVSALPAGVYFVRVGDKVSKFVKM